MSFAADDGCRDAKGARKETQNGVKSGSSGQERNQEAEKGPVSSAVPGTATTGAP